MLLRKADVEKEYAKNPRLKREDVRALQKWLEKESHLPAVEELQLILFLHTRDYSLERAKAAIDNFFTIRTQCPEFSANRSVHYGSMPFSQTITVMTHFRNPSADTLVVYLKFLDKDPAKFHFHDQVKMFDMLSSLWWLQEGAVGGMEFVFDARKSTLAHLTRINFMVLRKYLYYYQEAAPVKIKSVHIVNSTSILEKVLTLMKPFFRHDVWEKFHIHDTRESLYEYVPQKYLPEFLGGSAGTLQELNEQMKEALEEHDEFFKTQEKQIADESRRIGKIKDYSEIFGVEGSFKKLSID